MSSDDMKTEIRIARGDSDFRSDFARLGQPSSFTCPECHGSMRRIDEGSNRRYRCHTGHAFGEATLANEQSRSIERVAEVRQVGARLRELIDDVTPDGAGEGRGD
jgi:two-component system chemotaxis response regulator CheB